MDINPSRLEKLIDEARVHNRDAIESLLTARGDTQEALFSVARSVRDAAFGRNAVLRGVIEVTSACVKSCYYCPMRIENREKRYFRRADEILEAVKVIRSTNIGIVFFQGGEIPATTHSIGDLIPKVREIFGGDVEILLCLGDKSFGEFKYLRDKGANSYIIKHETSDPSLHYQMRRCELSDRLRCISNLVDLGFRVGIGAIVGLPGQTLDSLIDDLLLPKSVGAKMTSVSPFIPAPLTPLEQEPPGNVELTLNMIALMRLLYPNSLIPTVSALERRGAGGQMRGFLAGANVITVNFTPEADQANYPIYGKDRFVVRYSHAVDTLAAAGLKPLLGVDAFSFWN